MGSVYGVSLKYIALSCVAGAAAQAVAVDTSVDLMAVPWLILQVVLWHTCLVNGLVAVLFNLRLGMRLLGKDPLTGSMPLWSYFALAGFHLPTWLYTRLHHWKDCARGVPSASEVEDGWWVGGRYAYELGKQWAGTVDLTCEFPEGCAKTTERYLLLRCWDGVPPPPPLLERAALFAVNARAYGDVMVHCAHGRGRSTTVMCACLVKAGLYTSWEAALEAIRSKRQVVKLNRSMRSALAAWQAEYVALTPRLTAGECQVNGGVANLEASWWGGALWRRVRAATHRVLQLPPIGESAKGE
mmetsp:Transcript_101768/g.287017  ORF Transcript_101768/g.287017 Transcript_101768/m.287017 type:complete len:299 (+) Transcript_101768:151-1047(+)